jgi:hypothetical protein
MKEDGAPTDTKWPKEEEDNGRVEIWFYLILF